MWVLISLNHCLILPKSHLNSKITLRIDLLILFFAGLWVRSKYLNAATSNTCLNHGIKNSKSNHQNTANFTALHSPFRETNATYFFKIYTHVPHVLSTNFWIKLLKKYRMTSPGFFGFEQKMMLETAEAPNGFPMVVKLQCNKKTLGINYQPTAWNLRIERCKT